MIKNKFLLCGLIILKNNELWAYPSLLFTDEEIKHIHENIIKKDSKSIEKLYLSAIVYVDDVHWSLWINDKIIRPENAGDIKGFQIEQVMPQEVKISWIQPHHSLPITFILQPLQTYIKAKQNIIDRKEKNLEIER